MSPIISEVQEKQLNKFIFHYRVFPLIAMVILFFIVMNIFTQLSRYSVYATADYNLPYPGILPNHKLYPLKAVRDRLLEFFTREPGKKAELYLLYADKRIHMAKILSDQKKWALAETTAGKAEKYLLQVRDRVEEAKAMGASSNVGFLHKIARAAKKHQQLLKSFIKHGPALQRPGFQQALKLNDEFAQWAEAQ